MKRRTQKKTKAQVNSGMNRKEERKPKQINVTSRKKRKKKLQTDRRRRYLCHAVMQFNDMVVIGMVMEEW